MDRFCFVRENTLVTADGLCGVIIGHDEQDIGLPAIPGSVPA
jgi:hypothetical protein